MTAVPTAPSRALTRRRSGRLVGGVAGGIADHLEIDVLWVRAAFVLLTAASGAGIVAYGLLWIFVRQESREVVRATGRTERQQALGLAALGIGVGFVVAALNDSVVGWVIGPLGVAAVGAAVVWREADEAQRRRWADGARTGFVGRNAVLRILVGALFVAAGIAVFLLGNLDLSSLQFGLLAVLATLAGVGVLTVPWWVRLVRDLGEERRERIVTAERAEIAAHLHDSVLQTLALIQRQAGDAREVQRLARGQERELRNWLYGPSGYGRAGSAGQAPEESLAAAVRTVAAEVEDAYAISVNPVIVGDHPLDDRMRALLLAAREAMVNAAKHAGVDEVSVYAEVEEAADPSDRPDPADTREASATGPSTVHVFVRDRGKGFDPQTIPDDRHGLADSIRGRMERHGGSVKLRSSPGEGTEVHLAMPLDGPRPATAEPGNANSAEAASGGIGRPGQGEAAAS